MVGLPARGKSYLSNKLQRYLLVRLPFPNSLCLDSSADSSFSSPAVARVPGALVPSAISHARSFAGC